MSECENTEPMTLDYFTALEVEMNAMCRASDLLPVRVEGYHPHGRYRLGDHMTEDDYRHGVRAAFGNCPEFEEWMVTPLVEAYRRHQQAVAYARDFTGALVGSTFGAGLRRQATP